MDANETVVANSRGVMPRCFEYLFSSVNREQQKVRQCVAWRKLFVIDSTPFLQRGAPSRMHSVHVCMRRICARRCV